jgi:flavin reductase ActVB
MSSSKSEVTSIAQDFKTALSCFPSEMTVVPTLDPKGRPRGFTASASSSLSLHPPLRLVGLATSADCHSAFAAGVPYVAYILRTSQVGLALRFGQSGHEKFGSVGFPFAEDGLPSLARLGCQPCDQGRGRSILVGNVGSVTIGVGIPAAYHDRCFWSMAAPTNSEPDLERYNHGSSPDLTTGSRGNLEPKAGRERCLLPGASRFPGVRATRRVGLPALLGRELPPQPGHHRGSSARLGPYVVPH